MEDWETVSDAWAGIFGVVMHPFLYEPELTASATDVILSCGVEDSCAVLVLCKECLEVLCELLLSLVCGGDMFLSFAYDGDSSLPDSGVE